METFKRSSAEHSAVVVKRERELAADLFRPHSEEELRELARALDRDRSCNQVCRLELALPHPQVPLPLERALND